MTSYALEATLAHIRPRIWRQLKVPGDLSLARLHDVLQLAFGWTNCHLHEFRVGNRRYGVPDPEGGDDALFDDADVTVAKALPYKSSAMEYIYDLGDCWIHKITVDRIESADTPRPTHRLRRSSHVATIACLAGERACPPEDGGGPSGYADFLDAITTPDHPQHDELLEWVGGASDPEAFSLTNVNRALSSLG